MCTHCTSSHNAQTVVPHLSRQMIPIANVSTYSTVVETGVIVEKNYRTHAVVECVLCTKDTSQYMYSKFAVEQCTLMYLRTYLHPYSYLSCGASVYVQLTCSHESISCYNTKAVVPIVIQQRICTYVCVHFVHYYVHVMTTHYCLPASFAAVL